MKVLDISHRNTPNTVYIGRPSKWGNPFVIGRDGTRKEVIEKFEKYLLARPSLLSTAKSELAGKDLVCFCAPQACHGDVFVKLINSSFEGQPS